MPALAMVVSRGKLATGKVVWVRHNRHGERPFRVRVDDVREAGSGIVAFVGRL